MAKGKNKLYKLLQVYALKLETDIGYTQGMNFVAALILMHVPNEALACKIFQCILQKDNWFKLYLPSTPLLFELSNKLMDKIQIEMPHLGKKLIDNEVALEPVIASPLLTLFSNILSFSESTHILNMFILDGEEVIIDLLMNVFNKMQTKIMAYDSQFEISKYLSKDVFTQAMKEQSFYVDQENKRMQSSIVLREDFIR